MSKGVKLVSSLSIIIVFLIVGVAINVVNNWVEIPFLMGHDITYSSPIWSKDGAKIYYVKNIEYWRINFSSFIASGVGGSAKIITKVKSYVMSMRLDTSGKKVIAKFVSTKCENENINGKHPARIESLRVLPNNEVIFFVRALTGYKGWLYKVKVDRTNLRTLLDLGEVTNPTELFISPDGTKIAYTKERYNRSGKDWKDIIGSVFSSWLMDADGQNNHMICGEESEIEEWTTNGYLIISAYADSEGNAKLKYGRRDTRAYADDVIDRTLIYDPTSRKFIKNIPNYFSSKETQEELKNLGFIEYDTSVSLDGKKKLFSWWDDGSIGIEDLDSKNKKVLLKGKKH